jgi:hypothetical protein
LARNCYQHNKNERRAVAPGSQAFFNIDVSRVRRNGSRQLRTKREATPPLPLNVFFLAVPQALSKFSCADYQKASLPVLLLKGGSFSESHRAFEKAVAKSSVWTPSQGVKFFSRCYI